MGQLFRLPLQGEKLSNHLFTIGKTKNCLTVVMKGNKGGEQIPPDGNPIHNVQDDPLCALIMKEDRQRSNAL